MRESLLLQMAFCRFRFHFALVRCVHTTHKYIQTNQSCVWNVTFNYIWRTSINTNKFPYRTNVSVCIGSGILWIVWFLGMEILRTTHNIHRHIDTKLTRSRVFPWWWPCAFRSIPIRSPPSIRLVPASARAYYHCVGAIIHRFNL